MARQDQPRLAAASGAGHDVVADALDVEVAERPQAALDMVGDGGFRVALRRDRHQLRGAGEQIGHWRRGYGVPRRPAHIVAG
jgi:hypothetical protein